MKEDLIFVLAKRTDPPPSVINSLPGARILIGDSAERFEKDAALASILFNWSGPLDLFKKVFIRCPNLRWVHSRSVGLERTLFPELVESPVPLTNGAGVFSASLGEFAIGAMLFFAKDFRRMIRNQSAGIWEPFDVGWVSGKTLGIVGYGDIGRAIAARAHALGMTVLALRRNLPGSSCADAAISKMYSRGERIAMISRCDFVVVATPLTQETRGMIGAAEIAAMKPNAVLINVGRGPVIDEKALLRALSAGQIAGAALDVFDQEPLPKGHPFYSLENVLLSPHCADHTPDWLENAMQFFIEQYARFRKGEPLLNIVDKRLGY
ncbi:MAG TPA: D-2-hydroxyacid dehydrogenase [Candidatus Acidoferrum sp.]|nr:D-2-hydroxyacid dehydrogenase [Candidatus Acidoferrum sp.]